MRPLKFEFTQRADGTNAMIANWMDWNLSERDAQEMAFAIADYVTTMRTQTTKRRKR